MGSAAEYCLKAGTRAFRHDFKTEAIRLLRLGLNAAARIESEEVKDRIGLDLRLSLRDPLFQLGRIVELRRELDAALSGATATVHPTRVGKWLTHKSHILWFTGDSDGALDAAQSAMNIGISTSDAALQARARFQQGLVFLTLNRLPDCVDTMREVLDRIRDGLLVRDPRAAQYGLNASLMITARSYPARASTEQGHYKVAQAEIRLAKKECRILREPFSTIFVLVAQGHLALHQHAPKDAIKSLRHACALCDSTDTPLLRPVAASLLALALIKDSQLSPALAMAQSAVDLAGRIGFAAHQPFRLAVLADALWYAGRERESADQARIAFDLARTQIEPGSEAYASAILGRFEKPLGSAIIGVTSADNSEAIPDSVTPL